MTRYSLVPHPDHPPDGVEAITVQVERDSDDAVWLEYCVKGTSTLVLPKSALPARTDGLWKTTCFELFARQEDEDGYLEFNFSPSMQWAAYRFDAYRTGSTDLPANDPEITISIDAEPYFFIAAEPRSAALTLGKTEIGLSAVIEEQGGAKSYWALFHAPGPPDFHNSACFTATLPAPHRP